VRKSKLGVQALAVDAKALSWVKDVHPRVFKIVIVGDKDFTDWDIPDDVFLIARYYGQGDVDYWEWTKGNARTLAAKMVELSKLHGGRVDAWECINEPVVGSAASMKRLARFEKIWVETMHDYGLQTIVGNFAVGNPANISLMQHFAPAIEVADYFGYHGYGCRKAIGDEWTTFRYRKLLEAAGVEKPVILTECGVDCGGPYKGYRKYWTDDEYALQLINFDRALLNDPRVFAACVYCYGTFDQKWASFDLSARAAMSLGDHIKTLGNTTPEFDYEKLEKDLRNWAWNHLPWGEIPYNPNAALAKVAIRHGLGMPLSGEIRTNKQGRDIVYQVFVLGVVWCFEGDYANIHIIR